MFLFKPNLPAETTFIFSLPRDSKIKSVSSNKLYTALTAAIFAGASDCITALIDAEDEAFSWDKHPGALQWALEKRQFDLVKKHLKQNSHRRRKKCGRKITHIDLIGPFSGIKYFFEYEEITRQGSL